MNRLILPQKQNQPYIKVGVLNDYKYYDLTVKSSFKIYGENRTLVHSEEKNKTTWRFKLSHFRKITKEYGLLISQSYQKNELENVQKQLKGLKTEIISVGGDIYYSDEIIHSNQKYLLFCFDRGIQENYKSLLKTELKGFQPKLVEIQKKQPAPMECFDSDYKFHYTQDEPFYLELDDESAEISINQVERFDPEFKKTYTKTMHLTGNVTIAQNADGMLDLINEIPTERYIHRVIYSELGNDMPLEFYKAMAIVCRCEILNRFGQRFPKENYDVHANEDRLLFKPERYQNEVIDNAIQSTKFEVMYYEKKLCQAFFHITSGGVIEDGNLILNRARKLNYGGGLDVFEGKKDIDLTKREELKQWVQSSPEVLSNIISLEDLPRQIKISKKYFRWIETISVSAIEKQLHSKLHEDVGTVLDIIPRERGKSGRIIEIEIIGTHRNISIRGQERIGMLLSKTILPSTCFYIEKEYDEHGFVFSLILYGAGFGHGVGLCKTGATMMAKKGADYKHILEHYFTGVTIQPVIHIKG